jgi:hypothetical protein
VREWVGAIELFRQAEANAAPGAAERAALRNGGVSMVSKHSMRIGHLTHGHFLGTSM